MWKTKLKRQFKKLKGLTIRRPDDLNGGERFRRMGLKKKKSCFVDSNGRNLLDTYFLGDLV